MEIPSKAHAEIELACMLSKSGIMPDSHGPDGPKRVDSKKGGFIIGEVEIDLTNGVIVDSTLFCENPK